MNNFLIHLDFYPYYRLPSEGELDHLNIEIQQNYLIAKQNNTLNDILWSAIYFKMKKINTDIAYELPQHGTPRKLDTKKFNTKTGDINYPSTILDTIFSFERSVLNNKIKDFCLDSKKTFSTYSKAQWAIDLFQKSIKNYYSRHNNSEIYNYNINFLRSLEYEIRKLI